MDRKSSRRQFMQWCGLATGAAALAACAQAPAPTQAPAEVEAPAEPTSQEPVATEAPATEVPQEEPTTAPVAETVEIEYYTYDLGPANKSREELIAAFQEANAGVKVKLTILPYGENWEKLAALMAAGTPPDVIYGDFSLLRYALEGQLLDLTEYFNADAVLPQADQFTMDIQDGVQAKFGTSRIYNLILGTWVPILYYNKEIFDAAGEPYPSETWTWDDVRAAAKKLVKPDGEQFGFQFGTTLDHVGWIWWEQKPADFWAVPQVYPEKTAFNSETGINVMKVYESFGVAGDNSMMPFSEGGSYQVYGGAFGAGKSAMYSGGDWDAGWGFMELPFKWDMTFTPRMTADYLPMLNTMVATSCIAAGTKSKDASWQLARYITASKEGQSFIGTGAYETPVLKEVAHSDAVMKPEWAVEGYGYRVKAAELPGPMYTPYQLSLNLWEYADKYLNGTVEKMTLGEMTPEEAVVYLDQEGGPYFSELKKTMPAVA